MIFLCCFYNDFVGFGAGCVSGMMDLCRPVGAGERFSRKHTLGFSGVARLDAYVFY